MVYLLDVFVAVYRGREALGQHVEHAPLLLRELLALLYVQSGDVGGHLLGEEGDVVGDDDGPEGPPCVPLLLVRQTPTQIASSIDNIQK